MTALRIKRSNYGQTVVDPPFRLAGQYGSVLRGWAFDMLEIVYLCICLARQSGYIADREDSDFRGLDRFRSKLLPRCHLAFIPSTFLVFLALTRCENPFYPNFLTCDLLYRIFHAFSKRGLCLYISSSQPLPSSRTLFNLSIPISIFAKDLFSVLLLKTIPNLSGCLSPPLESHSAMSSLLAVVVSSVIT